MDRTFFQAVRKYLWAGHGLVASLEISLPRAVGTARTNPKKNGSRKKKPSFYVISSYDRKFLPPPRHCLNPQHHFEPLGTLIRHLRKAVIHIFWKIPFFLGFVLAVPTAHGKEISRDATSPRPAHKYVLTGKHHNCLPH